MGDDLSSLNALALEGAEGVTDGPQPVNPLDLVKRLLRGRLHWAVLLGMVIGVGAAGYVYKSTVTTYRSQGLIEVVPKVPKILYDNDQNSVPPMFDGYMQSQERLLRSRRVIDMAMRSDTWRDAGGGHSDGAVIGFQFSLFVRRNAKSQFIEVAFVDRDPGRAKAAVDAVMDAYLTVVTETELQGDNTILAALEEKQRDLKSQLDELLSHELTASEDFGPEVIQRRYDAVAGEISGLELLINQLEVDIGAIEASRAATGQDDLERELTIDEMGVLDPEIARLARARDASVQQVETAKEAGLGSRHPRRAAAEKQLEEDERLLAERIMAFKTLRASSQATVDPELVKLRQMQTRLEGLVELRKTKKDELKELAVKQSRLDELALDRAQLVSEQGRVEQRIEQLLTESGKLGGRIRKAAEAERPVAPESDRRKQLGLAAGFGGFCAGFVLVALYGLLNSRMRHVEDMTSHESRGRFIGILPDLAGAETEADVEMGDFCVHHVRTLLQLRSNGKQSVVALTSASAGAGKTTLGLALGTSFGATGARALLIDCDFVGRGLTSALRSLAFESVERALAGEETIELMPTEDTGEGRSGVARMIAARSREISAAEIEELLQRARSAAIAGDRRVAKSIGVLEAMCRYSDSPTNGHRRGVLDALEGRDLEDCVFETTVKGLSVLPTGHASSTDASRLSPERLAALLNRCRQSYDTVLIDTGPILGSLEASFVAAAADQVLCVVTRGEKRSNVNQALKRLEGIGVDVAGLVFNRANDSDVMRSSYTSASASVTVGAE